MTGARAAGTLPSMQTDPSTPPSASATCTCRVADLDRSLAFYRDALGLGVTADGRAARPRRRLPRRRRLPPPHRRSTRGRAPARTPPPPGHTGLYHVAFLYPDRRELGRAVQRLLDHGSRVDHATDHGGTRRRSTSTTPTATASSSTTTARAATWFDADGRPVLKADRFDYRDLLR